jgi:hypothetical protein
MIFFNVPDYFNFGQLRYSLKFLNISNCSPNNNCLKAISDCQNLKTRDILGIKLLSRNVRYQRIYERSNFDFSDVESSSESSESDS